MKPPVDYNFDACRLHFLDGHGGRRSDQGNRTSTQATDRRRLRCRYLDIGIDRWTAGSNLGPLRHHGAHEL